MRIEMHQSKTSSKTPFFCPFSPYCVSFLETNWTRLHKVAPLEEKNISTCCRRCLLPDYILCWSICVNNNKLLTVNTQKTTVGSKFRRICMGNVSFYNSTSFQHAVLKLSGWHLDNVGNIVKARFLLLRMPGVIAFYGWRITKVTVAKVDGKTEMVPGHGNLLSNF